MTEIQWPVKQREIQNHHMDSTCWNDFPFRDDDVVIATYLKSGTTWMQQIVGQLIFEGKPDVHVAEVSPWIEQRLPGAQETHEFCELQQHRRFLKTHLPVDALVFSPNAKYVYVARDGRDVVWSMYNHHARANELYYEWINNMGRRVGPPFEPPSDDVREYFLTWLERDGHPWWSYWEAIGSWWSVRDLPNVMLMHYADLKADLPGEIARLADFLDIKLAGPVFDTVVEHCSFEWMKENANLTTPYEGAVWSGGSKTFIHKGTNGRWMDVLTDDDIRLYEERVVEELGEECAAWLAHGSVLAETK